MNAWVWLGLILLVLLALVALVLVSYLRLETCLSEREQVFRVRWLGSSIVFEVQKREVSWWILSWRMLRKPLGARRAKPKELREKEEEKKPRDRFSLKPLLSERQRIRDLWRYFRRSIHLEHLELNARLATPDPVWTGTLYGLVSSVIYPLKAFYPKARLLVRADFAHELPSGTLDLRLGVYVFRLAVLGLKAFPLIRKLRQDRNRKEDKYGSSNPSQRTGRGYASGS